MASRIIRTCDKCKKEVDSTTKVFFGYEKIHSWSSAKEKVFEVDVCEKCQWEIRDAIKALVREIEK